MRLKLLAVTMLGLLLPTALISSPPVYAQETTATEDAAETPPLPRPRPDRDAATSPTPAPNSDRPPAGATISTPATDAISALTSVPQPVTLSAKITEDGADITEGIVWRIFNTQTDNTGELALAAKSELAAPTIELPPGEYVVHIAYGRAQTSDTLTVVTGQNTKTMVLDAGALRLNAMITGEIAIPPDLVTFDIFTSGTESERREIAADLAPNDIVTLNAGTYHIVSDFGTINAVVRADLRVEPGQLTDATLYHKASQIAFKLVSETGGEAIADVEWTVQSRDGEVLFTDLGAFPATVLAEGDYTVLAKLGQQVYNREFAVQSGAAREIEVLTAVY